MHQISKISKWTYLHTIVFLLVQKVIPFWKFWIFKCWKILKIFQNFTSFGKNESAGLLNPHIWIQKHWYYWKTACGSIAILQSLTHYNRLKGVCLLHLSSENIFHALRSIWFYVLMKLKWIWNLSLCYFSLFCFYSYRLWWANCWEEKWFNLAHVIQTNFEGVLFPLTSQLANSRDAISRHLYYKVFK